MLRGVALSTLVVIRGYMYIDGLKAVKPQAVNIGRQSSRL